MNNKESISIRWWFGLSCRAVNVLNSIYQDKYKTKRDIHKNLPLVDLDSLNNKEMREMVKRDIELKNIILLRVNNCGKKTREEIVRWANE